MRFFLFTALLAFLVLAISGCERMVRWFPQFGDSTAPVPRVHIRASPGVVSVGERVDLVWRAEHVARCEASGAWQGGRELRGKLPSDPIFESQRYTLVCTGPHGRAASSVVVYTAAADVVWLPHQDVEALSDIAGYVVRWGQRSGVYTRQARVAADQTRWELDEAPGTYYLVVTAVDRSGVESAFSNEVIKHVH